MTSLCLCFLTKLRTTFFFIWHPASCASLNFFDSLGGRCEQGEKSLHKASFSTEIQQSNFHPELFPSIGFVSCFLECWFSTLKESNCRHLTTHIKGCCSFKWEMKACDFKHIKAFNAGTLEKATEDLPAQYYLYCLGWCIRASLQSKISPEEPNPSPEHSLHVYLMIQEHNLAKPHGRIPGQKSFTLPLVRWCLAAHPPRKTMPGKLDLQNYLWV